MHSYNCNNSVEAPDDSQKPVGVVIHHHGDCSGEVHICNKSADPKSYDYSGEAHILVDDMMGFIADCKLLRNLQAELEKLTTDQIFEAYGRILAVIKEVKSV